MTDQEDLPTDIHVAAARGDIKTVKDLVISGHDIQVKNESGGNLLHAAAQGGNVELFTYLTDLGLDPREVEKRNGWTVLQTACRYNRYDMIQFLCVRYQDLKTKLTNVKGTALHICAVYCSVDVFKFLVEQGLDVFATNNYCHTVLHAAASVGNYDMVKYLMMEYPNLIAIKSKAGYSAVHRCAQHCDNLDVFRYMINHGCDVLAVSKENISVLHAAAWGGQYDTVKFLVTDYPQLKKRIAIYKETVLHLSARGGNVEVFKYLIDEGFNVNDLKQGDENVLHIACRHGKLEMANYIIMHYPDLATAVTTDGRTPLLLAAENKHDAIISCLLHHGVDPYQNMSTTVKFQQTSASNKGDAYLMKFIFDKYLKTPEDTKQKAKRVYLHAALEPRKHLQSVISSSGVSSITDVEPLLCSDDHSSVASEDEEADDQTPTISWSQDIGFLSPSMIREYIRKDSISEEVQSLLHWICTRLKSTLTEVDHTWCGYRTSKPSEPVLVAVMNEAGVAKNAPFDTFDVVCRKVNCVSREAKDIADMEISKGLTFTQEEAERVHNCLTRNSKHLMDKHSNLQIVSASKFKSKRYGFEDAKVEDQVCIVLYVHIKGVIPFHEDPFPDTIDGIPADVREGKFRIQSNPLEYHEQLLMGCQIASAYGKCGTLGGFVQLDNHQIGCLTCWHIFDTNVSRIDGGRTPFLGENFRKEVFQPTDSNLSCQFGKLIAAHIESGDENSIGVDVALIEITDRQREPVNGQFPSATNDIAGFKPSSPMVYTSGKVVKGFDEVPRTQNVVKYGCATQHTVGMIRLSGPAVCQRKVTFHTSPQDKYEMYQQLEIFPPEGTVFSDFGDSGSLVFTVNDKGREGLEVTALGLLVGKTSYDSGIVTPIWAILNKLGLPLKMLEFPGYTATTSSQTDQTEETAQSVSLRLSGLEMNVATMKTDIASMQENIHTLDEDVKSTGKSMRDQQRRIEETMRNQQHIFDNVRGRIEETVQYQGEINRNVQEMDTNMQRQMNAIGDKIDQKYFVCTIL